MKYIFVFLLVILLGNNSVATNPPIIRQNTITTIPKTDSDSVRIIGHYHYQHGWEYPVKEGFITVHETGTMDFCTKDVAFDSARQNYTLTLDDTSSITWLFDYVSPSFWHLSDSVFFFKGFSNNFRMEVLSTQSKGRIPYDPQWIADYGRKIIADVKSSIDKEIAFRLAEISLQKIVWTYTYKDGHTDTWEFFRSSNLPHCVQ